MEAWLIQGFNGISLASILLLISLGLAFAFGLMGVINMAHGEFIMVGAYTTYVFETIIFGQYLQLSDTTMDWGLWFVLSIPVAFLIAVQLLYQGYLQDHTQQTGDQKSHNTQSHDQPEPTRARPTRPQTSPPHTDKNAGQLHAPSQTP